MRDKTIKMIDDGIMKTQQAFTLVELMVTLAAVAILAMVALPNMRSMLLNNQIISKTNDFISAINYVRTESITNLDRPLQIQTLGTANYWTKGWRIVDDSQDDGWGSVDENEEVLKIFEFDDSIVLKKLAGDSTISYKSKGRVQEPYQFLVCHPDYPQGARIITIGIIGRAATKSCALGEAPCPASCN